MNEKYIVSGDHVLTMNDKMDVIKNGAVVIQGKKIIEVGDAAMLFKKYPGAKTIGGKGHVVMPGLINTHNHAPMVYLRGISNDLPLKQWLESYIWPIENKFLCPEYVSDATDLACIEMLRSGTTTYADMYFYCDEMAKASKKIGIRAMLGETGFDFPTTAVKSLDEYFKRAEKFIIDWRNDDLIIPSIAPHAPYTCSTDTLKKAGWLAKKHGIPIQIHVAETEWEINEIQSKYGKRPISYLDSIGFLDNNVIAAHCVFADAEDIKILAERQVSVAHCIESNLKLASGFAPIPEMLETGVKIGFGTDGAASNNDLNMFGEISTVAKVHKAVKKDPTVMDAKTVLLLATKGGAKALGINNLGYLAPNCLADVITLDFYKPHLLPMYDVYSHLVYAATGSDVANVLVNGRVLMQNGVLSCCNVDRILAKANLWYKKITAKNPHKLTLTN